MAFKYSSRHFLIDQKNLNFIFKYSNISRLCWLFGVPEKISNLNLSFGFDFPFYPN